MKSLMESLNWKECGYYLVADIGRWRLTVTRGEEVGYFVASDIASPAGAGVSGWAASRLPQAPRLNDAAIRPRASR